MLRDLKLIYKIIENPNDRLNIKNDIDNKDTPENTLVSPFLKIKIGCRRTIYINPIKIKRLSIR